MTPAPSSASPEISSSACSWSKRRRSSDTTALNSPRIGIEAADHAGAPAERHDGDAAAARSSRRISATSSSSPGSSTASGASWTPGSLRRNRSSVDLPPARSSRPRSSATQCSAPTIAASASRSAADSADGRRLHLISARVRRSGESVDAEGLLRAGRGSRRTAAWRPPGRPTRSTSSGAEVRTVAHPDESCVTVLQMLSISNDESPRCRRPDPRRRGELRGRLRRRPGDARRDRAACRGQPPDRLSPVARHPLDPGGAADRADHRRAATTCRAAASAASRWSSASSRWPNAAARRRRSCRCCTRPPNWRWSTSPSASAPASRSCIDAVAAEIKAAQDDGSVRAGDPRQLAAMCLLITQSTIQSAQIVEPILDAERWPPNSPTALNGYLSHDRSPTATQRRAPQRRPGRTGRRRDGSTCS